MKVIILAGGSGTRLWPLSRERYPKQFLKMPGKNISLFQETFKRSLLLAETKDIYVITNENYQFLVKFEIENLGYDCHELNILVEPEAKNTLPAIYTGVHEIIKKGHDSVVVFPSDHLIKESKEFADLIIESEQLTRDYLITFGIKPDKPNTGYGYILPGNSKENGYLVKVFKEKPTYEKAVEYLDNGYYWNSGICMFNSAVFNQEVEKYQPDVYNAFKSSTSLKEAYRKIETKLSVDIGIIERSSRVVVVLANIGWNDVGSFDSFYDFCGRDEFKNISNEENVLVDSTNNLICTEAGKLVSTVGVNDLIIIDRKDALLVCKKGQSQKVKNVVEALKEKEDRRTEYHSKDYRPWGHYQVLEEEKNSFKIKRIIINPGKKISYQLHHHRSEHWIVVKGMAKVTIEDEVKLVSVGESSYMKAGYKHRLENPGKIDLEIIEVQMGEYLEEDDIVRFDDEYGRI